MSEEIKEAKPGSVSIPAYPTRSSSPYSSPRDHNEGANTVFIYPFHQLVEVA